MNQTPPTDYCSSKYSPPCQYCKDLTNCFNDLPADLLWNHCPDYQPTYEALQKLPKEIVIILLGDILNGNT
jgi:hypothetical protein